jgi:hypothetical protein
VAPLELWVGAAPLEAACVADRPPLRRLLLSRRSEQELARQASPVLAL